MTPRQPVRRRCRLSLNRPTGLAARLRVAGRGPPGQQGESDSDGPPPWRQDAKSRCGEAEEQESLIEHDALTKGENYTQPEDTGCTVGDRAASVYLGS